MPTDADVGTSVLLQQSATGGPLHLKIAVFEDRRVAQGSHPSAAGCAPTSRCGHRCGSAVPLSASYVWLLWQGRQVAAASRAGGSHTDHLDLVRSARSQKQQAHSVGVVVGRRIAACQARANMHIVSFAQAVRRKDGVPPNAHRPPGLQRARTPMTNPRERAPRARPGTRAQAQRTSAAAWEAVTRRGSSSSAWSPGRQQSADAVAPSQAPETLATRASANR